MNGFTCMSLAPTLKAKEQIMNNTEQELWPLQNGNKKYRLSDKLSFYQSKLDILGKFILYFKLILCITDHCLLYF